jgi:hypothetical protein
MKKQKTEQPKNNDVTPVDYERLGRMLELVFMTGYHSRRRYYLMAFVKGAIAGLGSVIGATFLIAVLLYVLSFFETIPLIGPIVENFQQTVESPPADTP